MLLALLLLCSNVASAHDFEVDGIYYNITDATAKTAEVASGPYSGAVTVTVPSSVTCDGTTYSVTSIGYYAFNGRLTSIEIPNSVTSIGGWAFAYCTGLTSIEIPNSVTSIGHYACNDCKGLKSVTIPNSVTSIGRGVFAGCTGLESIIVDEGNTTYDSREDCNAIIETATKTLIIGCKNTIIPNSVTSIGEYAFYKCTGLTSITIPNSVTSIGRYAFEDCTGLTSIEIPNSVTSIGEGAFAFCTGLTSVTIGEGVTSIGEGAFANCTGLTSITSYIPADKLFAPGSNAFYNIDKTNCTLYVPFGAKAIYQATDGWKDFVNIVEMEEGTTSIDNITSDANEESTVVYDLNGNRVTELIKGRVYIKGGKKFIYQ